MDSIDAFIMFAVVIVSNIYPIVVSSKRYREKKAKKIQFILSMLIVVVAFIPIISIVSILLYCHYRGSGCFSGVMILPSILLAIFLTYIYKSFDSYTPKKIKKLIDRLF